MSWIYPTTVYLRREDFPRMLEAPLKPRDQVALRLGAKMGLRPVEIRLVRVEDVDFQGRRVHLDYCGRTRPRTVPADPETLELIWHYTADRHAGILLKPVYNLPKRGDAPLSDVSLWKICRDIAKAAGIPHWKQYYPYLWRHFFAADWASKGGSLNTLRRILGHQSLATTTLYLNRLIFWENHLGEYDRIKGEIRNMEETEFYHKWCKRCGHRKVCRHIEQACLAGEWAGTCLHFILETPLKIPEEQET